MFRDCFIRFRTVLKKKEKEKGRGKVENKENITIQDLRISACFMKNEKAKTIKFIKM
jgi:hypothetical protein